MNAIHSIVWSKALKAWVVVAETAKALKKKSSKTGFRRTRILAALVAFPFPLSAMAAACSGDGSGYIYDVSGLACTISSTNFGQLIIGGSTQATSLGSVNVQLSGSSSQAVRVWDSGSLTINGNLNATRSGAGSVNAALQLGAWPSVGGASSGPNITTSLVTGTTSATSDGGDAVRLIAGSHTFLGDFSATKTGNSAGFGVVAARGSVNIFGGNVTVISNGYGPALWADGDASYSIAGDLTVRANSTISPNANTPAAAVILIPGSLSVAGSASISTKAQFGYGIYAIANSIANIQGINSTITTSGAQAPGVVASGGASVGIGKSVVSTLATTNVEFASGRIETFGDQSTGIVAASSSANGTAEVVQSGGIIITHGNSAVASGVPSSGSYGISASNTVSGLTIVDQTGGGVTTSGLLGYGIFATNSNGSVSVSQNGTVTTSGELGVGVVSKTDQGDLVVKSAGVVSTSGVSASGMMAISAGNVTVDQSTGSISTTGMGQSSYLNGVLSGYGVSGISVNNAAGIVALSKGAAGTNVNVGTINVTGSGVVANAQNGDVKIRTNSGISAKIDGIDATSQTGQITIQHTGSINSGASGISAISNSGNVVIQQLGVIAANQGDGIVANTSAAGAVIDIGSNSTIAGGSAGIHITSVGGSENFVSLNSGSSVAATSGVAIQDAEGNTHLQINSGATLSGKVLLGNGSDTVVISGAANINGVTLLDAGNSLDSSVSDVISGAGAAENKLSFVNTSQSIAASVMKNWQVVRLNNANIDFSGDANLTTGAGLAADGGLHGLILENGSVLTSSPALAVSGDVTVYAGSTINHQQGGFIAGNVNNYGLINWVNLNKTLSVSGNYVGFSGSQLSLETQLGGDGSPTDSLHVAGDSSGTTLIKVRNKNGVGGQTVNGIRIVQIDGTSGANNFSLLSPVQAGAYEYALKKGSGAGDDLQSWYLVSTFDCKLDNSCAPIYRPQVPIYVSASEINRVQGMNQIGTWHQRIGGSSFEDGNGLRTWVRPHYSNFSGEGETRFAYESEFNGFQLGKELYDFAREQGESKKFGFYVDYDSGYSSINDEKRLDIGLDNRVGGLRSQATSLGVTYTSQGDRSSYFDAVLQYTFIKNNYLDVYGQSSSQKASRFSSSVEVGREFGSTGGWNWQSQAQLIYMHTGYHAFDDGYSHIEGFSTNNFRARVGVRAEHASKLNPDNNIYLLANLINDFGSKQSVQVGSSYVGEVFSRTRAEVGVGGQYRVGKSTYLFGDARYQYGIDSEWARSAQFNVGIKSTF